MKRPVRRPRRPITAADIADADVVAEQFRERWLVRNGHRAYEGSSHRRVVGVHAPRPSESRPEGGNASRPHAGHPSSALGFLGLLVLLSAGFWLAFFGLIWLAIQVLLAVGNFVWGKA